MGSVHIQIQEAVIDFTSASCLLEDEGCGAVIWFLGNVRKTNEGKDVLAVEYEAHRPLAEKTLKQICLEAQATFGADINLLIFHRIGRLNVGECSVLIGASSPHRENAYSASRFLIESLKKRVPIWKNEIYVSGNSKWLAGNQLHGN